ncbi:MAG TPA: MFS transporter [Candidatus Aphodovivens excrementavium]|nr:MFS transporter [Candidatus Aphodovivens excrementavium]
MSAINPGVYKAIVRVREARLFDIGCFLMRFLPYMNTIGTVTMLTLSGFSFFVAGLVSSTIALATFIVSPRVSKLIDTYGQSRVVPWAALANLVGLCLMVAVVALEGAVPLLFVAAVLMGCTPNPPALARARWTYLIRSGKLGNAAPVMRTMFSYEGVLDDVGFMFSPSLSVALASAIAPFAGMVFGGAAFALGTVLLLLSRNTEPRPGWSEVVAEGVEEGAEEGVGAARTRKGVDGNPAENPADNSAAGEDFLHRKSVFRTTAVVRVMFFMMLFVGAFYGVFDTATVSFAEEMGDPTFASIVLMASAITSMLMGFVFGMIRLRMPQYRQLVLFAVIIGLAYGTMMFIDSPMMLFVVGTLAGLAYAPFLIVINATCERSVSGDRLTEAITWINAGITCGMAFGPTAGGVIIDTFGAARSFDFGALLALAIPVTALVCFRIIKRNVRNETELSVAYSSKDDAQ